MTPQTYPQTYPEGFSKREPETGEPGAIGRCVQDFAEKLELLLAANGRRAFWRESPQTTFWRESPQTTWLIVRLRLEVEHIAEAMATGQNVRDECLNVAAFAMMIWDLEYLSCDVNVARSLHTTRPPG